MIRVGARAKDYDAALLWLEDVGIAKKVTRINSAEFKGALAEQFIFQELIASGTEPFYYATDDSKSEIDFIIQTKDGSVLPIEVKSGTSISSASAPSNLKMCYN